MKKNDKHELYCSCERCKPASRALVILKPGELPLLEREPEAEMPGATLRGEQSRIPPEGGTPAPRLNAPT